MALECEEPDAGFAAEDVGWSCWARLRDQIIVSSTLRCLRHSGDNGPGLVRPSRLDDAKLLCDGTQSAIKARSTVAEMSSPLHQAIHAPDCGQPDQNHTYHSRPTCRIDIVPGARNRYGNEERPEARPLHGHSPGTPPSLRRERQRSGTW